MLKDLLKKTRTFRNFDRTKKIDRETLLELIALCRYTPSSANKQPLKFAFAYKQEDCAKILPLLAWAGYLPENKPPYKGNEPTAYILVCYDTDISKNAPEMDIGICSRAIVRGAKEKGIGACMIGSMDKGKMSEVFSLPANIIPRLIIALGAPNEKVVLTDAENGDIKYYRDADDTHFVPKRTLGEILLPEI